MGDFDDEPGQPSGSERLLPDQCIGHLLMIWCTGYIEHSPTMYSVAGKNSDLVVVDVVDLDLADDNGYQGRLFTQCWWRNGRLIKDLKIRIGRAKPYLAWMRLGIPTMGKPPYELELATGDEAAVARARAWMQGHPEFIPTAARAGASQATVTAQTTRAEQPVVRQKSQLELMAERQTAVLQRIDAKSALPLPPPAPPAQTEEPPF